MAEDGFGPAKTAARHIGCPIPEGPLRCGGELPAERESSERLVVSPSRSVEGLHRPQGQGMLGSAVGSGAFVAAPGTSSTDPIVRLLSARPEAIDDYLEFRQAVEGAAAECAAARATDVDLQVIASRMRRIENSHGMVDPTDEANADADLHMAVYEAAHNLVLLQVMRAFGQMLRSGKVYNRDKLSPIQGVCDLLLEHHVAIHAAIVARDPKAARAASEWRMDFTRVALKETLAAEARIGISRRRLCGGLSAQATPANGTRA